MIIIWKNKFHYFTLYLYSCDTEPDWFNSKFKDKETLSIFNLVHHVLYGSELKIIIHSQNRNRKYKFKGNRCIL